MPKIISRQVFLLCFRAHCASVKMPSKWKTSPRKKLKNKISEKNIQNSKMPWLTMVEQRKREQVRERVRKSRAQAKKRAREEQIEKTNEEKKEERVFC